MGTVNAVMLTVRVSQKTYMNLSHWKRIVLPYSTGNCSVLRGSLERREVWGRMDTWLSPFTVYLKLSLLTGYVVQSLSHVSRVDCSTLGFPILHYLLKFAQTHVH